MISPPIEIIFAQANFYSKHSNTSALVDATGYVEEYETLKDTALLHNRDLDQPP